MTRMLCGEVVGCDDEDVVVVHDITYLREIEGLLFGYGAVQDRWRFGTLPHPILEKVCRRQSSVPYQMSR